MSLFRKNAINTLSICIEWLLIVSIIYLNVKLDSFFLIGISIFIIGSRFHALGILMHEAAHFNLFTNRQANDLIGQFFLCSPFLISLQSYRKSHMLHHQYNLTEKDPTHTRKQGEPVFSFPKKSVTSFFIELLRIFCGYGIILNVRDVFRNAKSIKNEKQSAAKSLLKIIAVLLLVAIVYITHSGFWFLTLWLMPLFTVLPLLNYWRTVSEHSSLETVEKTRTVIYNLGLQWFLTPYNVNYHLEHHLFPKKPWFSLPDVRAQHLDRLEHGQTTHGIKNLFREFVS